MRQIDKNKFILEGDFQLDLRVWSLHELIQLFEMTGWKFEQAYPGSSLGHGVRKVRFKPPDDDLLEAGRFLIISSKSVTR